MRGPEYGLTADPGRITQVPGQDVWPRTKRLLPWSIALFLAIVCLVPIDYIIVDVSLPVDVKVDRIALGLIVAFWLLTVWSGGPHRPRIPNLGRFGVMLWLWVFVAFISIAVAMPVLTLTNELALCFKKFILLLAFVSFFVMVVSVIRPAEVRAFISYWIGLSTLLALGAVFTFVTKTDPFRAIAGLIFVGPFHVVPFVPPTDGSSSVTGPAAHQLALTTMLVLPMPFVLQRLFDATTTAMKLRYGAIVLLCAIGSVTTGRKSAVVVPIVIGLVMIAYRPRQMARLWPVVLIFLPLSHFVTPGALTTIIARADTNNVYAAQSTQHRIDDYSGAVPDIIASPLIGKGYGSNDPGTYRVLDNQWLGSLLETGVLGVAAMLGLLLTGWGAAHRLSRRARSADVRSQSIAVAAAIPAFIVSMGLYDALGFVEGFYLMFFLVGLVVVMNAGETGLESPINAGAPLDVRTT